MQVRLKQLHSYETDLLCHMAASCQEGHHTSSKSSGKIFFSFVIISANVSVVFQNLQRKFMYIILFELLQLMKLKFRKFKRFHESYAALKQ